MTDLRTAAQQALEAMEKATRFMSDSDYQKLNESIDVLRAALAEPERKPLTEEQVDRAYQEIWRTSPDDFGPTAGDWIEAGIRYAERAHGIIATEVNGDKDGSQG